MKIKYNREQDILLIDVSQEPIDYAEEVGSIIVHFTKENKPVLLEIMDASEVWEKAIGESIKEEVSELRALISAQSS